MASKMGPIIRQIREAVADAARHADGLTGLPRRHKTELSNIGQRVRGQDHYDGKPGGGGRESSNRPGGGPGRGSDGSGVPSSGSGGGSNGRPPGDGPNNNGPNDWPDDGSGRSSGRNNPDRNGGHGVDPGPVRDPRYSRPSGFRKGMRDTVWEDAKGPDTLVRDPTTGEVLDRNEPWIMGHRPGYEFRWHQRSAQNRDIGRPDFLDEHNNPDHYRPESPRTSSGHEHELGWDDYEGH